MLYFEYSTDMKIWIYVFSLALFVFCSANQPGNATEMDSYAELKDPDVIADLLVNVTSLEDKDDASDRCVALLRGRTFEQRKQIQNALFWNYGIPGRYLFKSEFDEDSYFAGLMEAMLYNYTELNAYILAESIKRSATDDTRKIIEILATNELEEILRIEKRFTFFSENRRTLRGELSSSSFSPEFIYLVTKLLNTSDRFNNNSISIESAKQSAENLFKYVEPSIADAEGVINILVENNENQLQTIFQQFSEMYFVPIEIFIDRRFKFCRYFFSYCDTQFALLDIVAITRDKVSYFAHRLHDMFEILKTKNGYFQRDPASVIMTRQFIDLKKIMAVYRQIYDREVIEEFNQITNFDYRRAYIKAIEDLLENST